MPYNIRDVLGHFVKPRSAEGEMCPHACCRGHRVHPINTPVILPNKLLRSASDDDLMKHYATAEGDSKHDRRVRAQVLHEMDRRDKAAAAGQRKYSRQLEQAEQVEASYVAAEDATRGNMVNRKGQARGVNPRTLITGREADFRRYASPELAEYYATHHRPTAASFRGVDTRVHPVASEPKRRRRGVAEGRWVRR
jgi:hypothetical protein